MPEILKVYGRIDCHLCEHMVEHLGILKSTYEFDLEVIDISGQHELEKLYGSKIPVLMLGDQEISHFTLDVNRFRNLMKEQHNK
ncbi:MAG TPA: glutaredoxin family protein [Gammaproteobacteria bacterium]|nr:glutaredoxin family protein [Gammaproteobacteria bacterium]